MSPAAITTSAPPQAVANGKVHALKSSTSAVITPSSVLPSVPSSQIPAWVQPDLERLLRVEHKPGSFASRSVSLVNLPAGALFARITTPTPAACAYSSVQASRDLHIELNCDLVFINHSCRPTLVFDMQRWEVRVNPELQEGLKEGDELTFFYPSTEWHMAQPFECLCKTSQCRGWIRGAKDMDRNVLGEYWLNEHIEGMLKDQDSSISNGHSNGSTQ